MTIAPEYLGDGAYVRLSDLGEVVLYTTDGVHTTNSVYLEPAALLAFKEWIERNRL